MPLHIPARLSFLLLLMALTSLPVSARTLMIVGDSLSAGYGLPPGSGWVDLLQQQFDASGHNIQIVNESISGDTTAGGRVRLQQALERHTPEWVMIELGGNDGLRGLSIDAMKTNLDNMLRRVREAGAQPLLVGIRLPPNYGARYTSAFEQVYQDLSQATNTPLLPFLLDGVGGNDNLMQEDGIHPNEAAQPLIRDNVAGFLKQHLSIESAQTEQVTDNDSF